MKMHIKKYKQSAVLHGNNNENNLERRTLQWRTWTQNNSQHPTETDYSLILKEMSLDLMSVAGRRK